MLAGLLTVLISNIRAADLLSTEDYDTLVPAGMKLLVLLTQSTSIPWLLEEGSHRAVLLYDVVLSSVLALQLSISRENPR